MKVPEPVATGGLNKQVKAETEDQNGSWERKRTTIELCKNLKGQ
jgi:hypothetical protein